MRRVVSTGFLVGFLIFAGAHAGGPAETAPSPAQRSSDTGRIIVKFVDGAKVRLRGGSLVSLGGATLDAVDALMAQLDSASPGRLFVRDERSIDRSVEAARQRSGRPVADLNGYYELQVEPDRVDEALQALLEIDVVQTAYRAPLPQPPPGSVDIPPTTPDFESMQGYLEVAPGGVDARWAWSQPGGRGAGVTVIDVEYDWNDAHEDLDAIQGQKLCFTPNGNFIDHGTSVMGEMAGGDNGYGVTGIVPDATFGMVTQDPVGMSNSVSRAVECAASLLGPGDVILMETQSSGPLGLLPSEWNQDVFDAVSLATALGITVVSAAGNGDVDLDDPAHLGRFDRSVRDSGAIIVGAGASPGSSQPDRSRLSFSTYGSRVDVQGWGHNVTTTGYGGLFAGGGDFNQEYTATFSGTSSASPVVTGAVAALQAMQLARGAAPLDPLTLRALLTATGSPQQSGPYAGAIGPRPDLQAAIASLRDLDVTAVVVDDAAPLGNGDGLLDPGESATLIVTLKNFSSQTASGIQGALFERDGVVSITQPMAGWPDLPAGQSAPSEPGHHRLTVDPDASCGEALQFELALTSSPHEELTPFALPVGRTEAPGSTDTPLSIPMKNVLGVTSTLNIPDSFTITRAAVSVEIAHDDIGEFSLQLISPAATTVMLHDHGASGTTDLNTTYPDLTAPVSGSFDDFVGESSAGSWQLQVIDDVNTANEFPAGTLSSWTLRLIGCADLACAEPVPGAMDDSFRVASVGVDDLQFSWDPSPGAASYRIWESGSSTFEEERFVAQGSGTSLLEPGGAAVGTLRFFQLRAVNSCEWEGP